MKYISENPLLLFRVDNIKKGLFHSSKSLKDRLERHKQNIDTSQLYRHLHTFYINTIHEVIHILEKNPEWSLAHVFSDMMLDYEFFIGSLGCKKDNISIDTVYYSSLKRQSVESAWLKSEG